MVRKSKPVKPNDDVQDDSGNLPRQDMQAIGETEHVEHNKAGADTGDAAEHEHHGITEEKPSEQSHGTLQTVIDPNTEAPPALALATDVETNGAASSALQQQQPENKRALSPRSSAEEAPAKKATKVNSTSAGEPESSTGHIEHESDNDMSKQLADLIKKRDFDAADALQKKIESQAANAKPTATAPGPLAVEPPSLDDITQAKIAELVAKKDYAGAHVLQTAAAAKLITVESLQKELESFKTEYENKIEGFIKKNEFAAAAGLQKNMQALESAMQTMFTNDNVDGAQNLLSEAMQSSWGKSSLAKTTVASQNPYTTPQVQARCAAVSARSAATTARTLLEDTRIQHEATLQQLVTSKNYQGAADYQKQMKEQMNELAAECRRKMEDANTAEASAKSLGVTLETDATKDPKDTQVRGSKPIASPTVISTCAQLFATDTPIMDRINIECAQVLAVGKVCSIQNKGKFKNATKGKSKGVTKGKQPTAKGKGKIKGNANGASTELQEAVAIYIGQEGYIVCIMTFGPEVKCLSPGCEHLETRTGCFVDLYNLKARLGQKGVLYFDDQSRLSECKQDHGTPLFEYDLSEPYQNMATSEFVKGLQVGDFVGIVLRITYLDEGETSNTSEPFLCIYGTDMDGITVGPIRLWRWTAADCGMQIGGTYVLRGLRVVKETVWSDEKWGYVPREDGAMTLEHNFRLAVEDVSSVEHITAFFD